MPHSCEIPRSVAASDAISRAEAARQIIDTHVHLKELKCTGTAIATSPCTGDLAELPCLGERAGERASSTTSIS